MLDSIIGSCCCISFKLHMSRIKSSPVTFSLKYLFFMSWKLTVRLLLLLLFSAVNILKAISNERSIICSDKGGTSFLTSWGNNTQVYLIWCSSFVETDKKILDDPVYYIRLLQPFKTRILFLEKNKYEEEELMSSSNILYPHTNLSYTTQFIIDSFRAAIHTIVTGKLCCALLLIMQDLAILKTRQEL